MRRVPGSRARLLAWAVAAVLLALALAIGLSGKGGAGGRLAPALPENRSRVRR